MKLRSAHTKGFTIVEVLVVIVIIGILVSIGGIVYMRQNDQSKNTTRESRAKIISESLENYYSRNGEYPGVGMVTQSNATNVTNILRIDKKNIVDPTAASSVTNSIVNYENYSTTTDTLFRYRGYAANLTTCRTATATGFCEAFILSYRDTTTSSWKEIRSLQGQSLLP